MCDEILLLVERLTRRRGDAERRINDFSGLFRITGHLNCRQPQIRTRLVRPYGVKISISGATC